MMRLELYVAAKQIQLSGGACASIRIAQIGATFRAICVNLAAVSQHLLPEHLPRMCERGFLSVGPIRRRPVRSRSAECDERSGRHPMWKRWAATVATSNTGWRVRCSCAAIASGKTASAESASGGWRGPEPARCAACTVTSGAIGSSSSVNGRASSAHRECRCARPNRQRPGPRDTR